MYVCAQLSLPLCNPIRLLSMGFSKQEYWNALPFPSPGNLPNPGIEPASLVSPALAGRFFTTELPGKPSDGRDEHKNKALQTAIVEMCTK